MMGGLTPLNMRVSFRAGGGMGMSGKGDTYTTFSTGLSLFGAGVMV